jgi:general L-amino acid transport system permease protein
VILWNLAHNLEQQGIASGFGFLNREAGFDISFHLIDYTEQSSYGRAFLVGILNTLLVSALGIVLATLIGFAVGIARLVPNPLLRGLAGFYVETLRNVPLLLQLFFWYFAVLRALPHPRQSHALGESIFINIRGLYVPRPLWGEVSDGSWLVLALLAVGLIAWQIYHRYQPLSRGRRRLLLAGWLAYLFGGAFFLGFSPWGLSWSVPTLAGFNFEGGWQLPPEFVALVLALSLYTASFIAEIVRAGLLSIGRGQREAAQALGLNRVQTLRLVILPQALRVIIPPLTSQYLNLTKNSSLAAAIAFPDLVLIFSGTVLNQTGQAVEVIALTMAVYLTISLAISLLMNWYNKTKALIGS